MMNIPKPSPPKVKLKTLEQLPPETQKIVRGLRDEALAMLDDANTIEVKTVTDVNTLYPEKIAIASEHFKRLEDAGMIASVSLVKASDLLYKEAVLKPVPRKSPVVIRPHLTQSLHENPVLLDFKKNLEEPKQPIKRNPRRKNSTRKTTEKN